jgi:hypothetical protein
MSNLGAIPQTEISARGDSSRFRRGFGRVLTRWSLVGLLLLPAFYWLCDFVLHLIYYTLGDRGRFGIFILFTMACLTVMMFLASVHCFRRWSSLLPACWIVALCTLLGILATSPTYFILQGVASAALRVPGYTSQETMVPTSAHDVLGLLEIDGILTLGFPLAFLSGSTYDGTLPDPLLAVLAVFFGGFAVRWREKPPSLAR